MAGGSRLSNLLTPATPALSLHCEEPGILRYGDPFAYAIQKGRLRLNLASGGCIGEFRYGSGDCQSLDLGFGACRASSCPWFSTPRA